MDAHAFYPPTYVAAGVERLRRGDVEWVSGPAIPEGSGLITALACPYNPAHLDRGPVYRFNVNHVVEPDDPYEMFRMEFLEVNGSQFARAAA